MSKNLTQIMADLFAKPLDGKELSSKIQRLGYEIRKIVQDDETMVGKFHSLLASFEAIIPDERQRYQAALQALCTTSKLSRQQIQKAMSGQLEELKALEKESMPAKSAWRDAMKSQTARSEQLKGEIAELREKLAKLESEERSLLAGMATREKELARVEKTVTELFTGMAAEISALCRKVEELTAEAPPAEAAAKLAPAAAKPAPPEAPKREAASARKQEVPPKPDTPLPDTKFRRKCPMCGGPFNLLELEKTWQCYICAYEEPSEG